MLNLFNKSKKHFKLRKDLSIQHFGRSFKASILYKVLPNGLKKGDYVENEDNLDGNAAVYGNAIKVLNKGK